MSSAAMMTAKTDAMRTSGATQREMLDALQVECDAYLEMGDEDAANEVRREMADYEWFVDSHNRKVVA